MSQQLIRLEREIQATTDRAEWIRLSAKFAIALARNGSLEEAHQRIALLRGISVDAQIGPFHVWVMLAEAITDWYTKLNASALDRVSRVQLLSSAMRFQEVHACSSAWKAHIQFELSDFDGMLKSLHIALASTDLSNNDANTRLAIVIFNAYSLCGDVNQAQKWFMRARSYALIDGDFPSVEALQYNRAVLTLSRVRVESSMGKADPKRIQDARRELESARNLHSITKNETLANHLHLAEARLLLLEGRYLEARISLAAVREKSPFASYHFSQSIISLEMGFCLHCEGETRQAKELLAELDFSSYGTLDIDEQLAALKIRTQLAEANSQLEVLNELNEQQVVLEGNYSKVHADLLVGLHDLEAQYKSP